MKKELFSPLEVARALGVSQASIKRWVDKGLMEASKTAGGHRKIALSAILSYSKNHNSNIVEPGILGLPPSTGRAKSKLQNSDQAFAKALEKSDEKTAKAIIADLQLSGIEMEEIFDTILRPALIKVKVKVAMGELDPFQERRIQQICLRLLYALEAFLPIVEDQQDCALIGTLTGDFDSLSTHMLEVNLRSNNWSTELLGTDLNSQSYIRAISMFSPKALIIAISSISDEGEFYEELKKLRDFCQEKKVQLILFGKISPEVQDLYKDLMIAKDMSGISELLNQTNG